MVQSPVTDYQAFYAQQANRTSPAVTHFAQNLGQNLRIGEEVRRKRSVQNGLSGMFQTSKQTGQQVSLENIRDLYGTHGFGQDVERINQKIDQRDLTKWGGTQKIRLAQLNMALQSQSIDTANEIVAQMANDPLSSKYLDPESVKIVPTQGLNFTAVNKMDLKGLNGKPVEILPGASVQTNFQGQVLSVDNSSYFKNQAALQKERLKAKAKRISKDPLGGNQVTSNLFNLYSKTKNIKGDKGVVELTKKLQARGVLNNLPPSELQKLNILLLKRGIYKGGSLGLTLGDIERLNSDQEEE